MTLSPTERTRRYRAKNGRPDRKPSPENERLKAEGKNPHGWLFDDGIRDMIAVEIAVSGERTPALTFVEACLVANKLTEIAKSKKVPADRLIADRLSISRKRAQSLMSRTRDRKIRGEL